MAVALLAFDDHLELLCRRELALDRANRKFSDRFSEVERLAGERGLDVKSAGLEKLDALWDEAKSAEAQAGRGG